MNLSVIRRRTYTRGRPRLKKQCSRNWIVNNGRIQRRHHWTLPEIIFSYSLGVNQWTWAWSSWAMMARRRTPLRKTKRCSWILWIKKDGKILAGVQSECEAKQWCWRVQEGTMGHSVGIRRAYRNWTGGGEGENMPSKMVHIGEKRPNSEPKLCAALKTGLLWGGNLRTNWVIEINILL